VRLGSSVYIKQRKQFVNKWVWQLYLYILLFTKRWSLLGNVNKMFFVGHIFDRSAGNLKPTIIFNWPWDDLSYNYITYITTILPILKQVAILFFTTLTPPPQKKDSTNQGSPPRQFCQQNRFNLMVTVLRIY
jgi:hypothetical protein